MLWWPKAELLSIKIRLQFFKIQAPTLYKWFTQLPYFQSKNKTTYNVILSILLHQCDAEQRFRFWQYFNLLLRHAGLRFQFCEHNQNNHECKPKSANALMQVIMERYKILKTSNRTGSWSSASNINEKCGDANLVQCSCFESFFSLS